MAEKKGKTLAETQARREAPEDPWEKGPRNAPLAEGRAARDKVDVPVRPPEDMSEKSGLRSEHLWDVYALPQPVVLVTTTDLDGNVNCAPKNWVTHAGARHFAFVCSTEHDTYMNAQTTREFVVNVPGADLVPKLHALARLGTASWEDELRRAGLTSLPSTKVKPPRIRECRAHLECKVTLLHRTSTKDDLGSEEAGTDVLVLGEVVAASADADVVRAKTYAERVALVRPFVLSPLWNYAVVDRVEPLPRQWDLEY